MAQTRRTLIFSVCVAADALELAFLQDAQQLGLDGRRHLADLVEEERAAVGELEAPFRLLTAPVNAPLSWPKSSLSISLPARAAQLT